MAAKAVSKKAIALWAGGGLVGAFALYHWWVKIQAQRRLDRLREQAIRGEIPTRLFLETVLIDGQPTACPPGGCVTVEEARRLPCSQVFPASFSSLPEFQSALNELRRNGTCL